ncbi:MAG TPA: ABC transporter ATP-binding protein [Kofleriaceae bacterium]|nr:ABC transporter ATP-binding protein [Kofleriaceae bacterium]
MIEARQLGRDYSTGRRRLTVLDGVDLDVARGEIVAVTGPSGSGKSTLLGLLAGLDRPSRGRVAIAGTELGGMDEDRLSAFRGRHIGFVFQSFQLISTLTAVENVRVPAELLGQRGVDRPARALLDRVGLSDRAQHYPAQLSGGEMQRVAIARAVITAPPVILADEPTGNLDSHAGEDVLSLLFELGAESAIVLVTHNPAIASRTDREVVLRDGKVEEVVPHRRGSA